MTTFDNGISCKAEEFTSEKAKQLVKYLTGNFKSYASLIECRSSDERDIVVTKVELEVSQKRINDIRPQEVISIHFDKNDKVMPYAYALREDFPVVPHLILGPKNYPPNLCLYSESYKDIKYSWTAPQFIERIRKWCEKTAKGNLHLEDQPLEPLFFGGNFPLVLPINFFESLEEKIVIKRLALTASGEILRASDLKDTPIEQYNKKHNKLPPVAFCIKLPPQEHGIVSHAPQNLYEVNLLVSKTGYDLFSNLYNSMISLTSDINLINSPFCIIGYFPKMRTLNATPETTDIWVFLSSDSVGKVGEEIGAYSSFTQNGGKKLGQLLARDKTKNGSNISVGLINPTFELTSDLANILSGYKEKKLPKILAVGLGAIGSHIVLNSIKSGLGKWVLIDKDVILPHNLVRYSLDGTYLGFPKVKAIQLAAIESIVDNPVIEALKTDITDLQGNTGDKIKSHLSDSSIILDMSASIGVARYIVHEIDSSARRISMFLSPSGKDFVILAEDKERTSRLDLLEMTYYKALISKSELTNHLISTSKTRYANSCRDLSSHISQDYVALHSAIGSRNLRQIIDSDDSYIKIYCAHDDMQVSAIVVPAEKFIYLELDGWKIYFSQTAAQDLFQNRENKLPNETGGVLIGSFDTLNKLLYVVDCTSAPVNSQEYPYAFIRGDEGLPDRINSIQSTTLGKLTYVGEWHSHPEGAKCNPSDDDKKILHWIDSYMSVEGLPSVMLIAGDKKQICFCVNDEIKTLEID